MIKSNFILLFLILSIHSNSIDHDDCSICQFDQYFHQWNGYGCFRKSINQTICTCPDRQLSTTNQPCRICDRKGICGSESGLCVEKSTLFTPNDNSSHFACICASNSFVNGGKCLDDTSIDSNTTTVLIGMRTRTTSVEIRKNSTLSMTTITKKSNTLTTPSDREWDDRSGTSAVSIKRILILFLNIVYFVNK